MADTINLIMPDGKIAPFKKADAEFHMKNQGWVEATPANMKLAKVREDADSLTGQGKAFLEGGARGLSAGFSDALESKYLGVDPNAIKARAAENPMTAGAGELAGGVGLGAALLSGAGELGLGGLGAAAAAGGVQGAANAVGNDVSQQVLDGNPDLVSEHLASKIALGGLLGGAGGAAGHFVAQGLGALGSKIANASSFAEEQALRDAGASGAQMEKLQKAGRLNEVGRALLDNDVTPGNATQGAANLASQAGTAGQDIGQQLAGGNPTATTNLAAAFRGLAARDPLDKIPKPYKAILDRYADEFAGRTDLSPQELSTVKKSLDEYISSKGGTRAPKDLLMARSLVSDAMEQAVQDPAAYAASKASYGSAKEAAKIAKGAVARDLAAGPQGEQVIAALKNGQWTKAAGEGASMFLPSLTKTADWVGSQATIQKIAGGAQKQITKNIAQLTTQAEGARLPLPSVGEYNQLADSVVQAANDPSAQVKAVQAFGPGLTTHDSDAVNAAAVKAQQAVQYLQQQLPKSPLPPGALDSDWQPSAYAKSQWLDKYRAIRNPESVATHPTEDGMEAIKAIYPEKYQQIVNELQRQVATNKNLTYQQKLKISRLTGPGFSTMTTPEFIDTMQQVQQSAAQPPQGQKNSARNQRAKQMNFKQAAQQEATLVNRFQEN